MHLSVRAKIVLITVAISFFAIGANILVGSGVALVSLGFAITLLVAALSVWVTKPLPYDIAERMRAEKELQKATDELEKQNTRLATLYRVGQMINSTLETGAILDRLTDEAMRVTHATHGQVLLVQAEAGRFERCSQRGFSPEETERARTVPLPLDQGINGRAYATRQPVCVDDVQAESGYFPLIPTTRAELAVPIIRNGQVLGNLDLQSPEAGAFRDVDLDYLNALADQAAIALQNAHLFEETQAALTEARNLAEALRVSEERFALAVQGSNDGIWDWDITNNTLYWSPRLKELLGYANVELEVDFDTFDSLLHPDDKELVAAAIEAHLKHRVPYDVEQRLRTKSGEYRWFQARGQAIWDEAGQPLRMVGFTTDITERARAEEQLQHYTTRLEQSNRELEEFAYVASHDLQEPLRKIQAFGDRLKTRHGQTLDDRGRDYLERMQNAAARMQTLINGLLTYSRVTTKAQPFAPVDLAQVAQEVMSDLEVRIQEVEGRVDVENLPRIEADPTQMRQLLQNLVANALKFHRQDQPPLVKVYADNASHNGLCQIFVEDNGIGFDEKYLDRIFQVFQRLHGRGEYEGSGVGLAICRKIVERHGGRITARSAPGQGATFIVTLPVRQSQGEANHQ